MPRRRLVPVLLVVAALAALELALAFAGIALLFAWA